MFARKLGRFAGLVFVLAALAGGAAATASVGHATGGTSTAFAQSQADIDWH